MLRPIGAPAKATRHYPIKRTGSTRTGVAGWLLPFNWKPR